MSQDSGRRLDCKTISPMVFCIFQPLVGGHLEALPIMGYMYEEAPPERGTFFRLEAYLRVGISRIELPKMVVKV